MTSLQIARGDGDGAGAGWQDWSFVCCAAMHASGKSEARLISNAALRANATHGPLGQLSYAKISPSSSSRSPCLLLSHPSRYSDPPPPAIKVFPMAEKKAKLNRGNYAHELRWTIKSRIAKQRERERGRERGGKQKKTQRTRQINYEQQGAATATETAAAAGGRGIYLRV